MERTLDSVGRVLQGAAVLLVLGFFLHSLGDILNPFVLFWVLAAVLFPFRSTRGYALLLIVTGALTFFWLLGATGSLLAPFVLALILAYILDPLVDWLEGRRVGRSLAIVLLTLPVLALLTLGVLLGIPALARETGDLIRQAPEFLARLADWLESLRSRVLTMDIPFVEEDRLLERLRNVESEEVVSFLDQQKDRIFSGIWSGVLGLGKGLGTLFSVLGYLVLTPVLTFYLLRDYDSLKSRVTELVPLGVRDRVVELASEYDRLVSQYLRGQITVAILLGVITALGLLVLGFPYAILLGVVVAVFNVVPYLGLVLSLVPAIFIALVSGNVLISLLKVAVVYGVAQGLEGAVISPRIVGESVGLHPVWVVLALSLGGFFFGFVGLLLGVPLAVGVKLLVVQGVERYRKSELFQGDRASPGNTTGQS